MSDAGRTSASLHTRTHDGRPLIDGKLADGSTYQPDGQSTPAESAAHATTGEKFKVGQYEVSEQEIGDLLAEKAARDLRAATVPPTPADYRLEVSPDAKLPGDVNSSSMRTIPV